ncbi:hypothetical protein Droror1_Dr00000224, partial [Drosera rotundifolia]
MIHLVNSSWPMAHDPYFTSSRFGEDKRRVFSRLLKKVSLAEVKLNAQLSYLGNLAYSIPSIK